MFEIDLRNPIARSLLEIFIIRSKEFATLDPTSFVPVKLTRSSFAIISTLVHRRWLLAVFSEIFTGRPRVKSLLSLDIVSRLAYLLIFGTIRIDVVALGNTLRVRCAATQIRLSNL